MKSIIHKSLLIGITGSFRMSKMADFNNDEL